MLHLKQFVSDDLPWGVGERADISARRAEPNQWLHVHDFTIQNLVSGRKLPNPRMHLTGAVVLEEALIGAHPAFIVTMN